MPYQFHYPIRLGQLVMEVEFRKFQKALLQIKCTELDNVFIFYETFQHITGSFNILLRSLQDITCQTGTCTLTPSNYLGYNNVSNMMSTTIYHKLTSSDYFKDFPQAMTYVRAASHTSNGFHLMYCILELVHPQLHQVKGGIHKCIHTTLYSDVTDDSIYTFLTKYE